MVTSLTAGATAFLEVLGNREGCLHRLGALPTRDETLLVLVRDVLEVTTAALAYGRRSRLPAKQ